MNQYKILIIDDDIAVCSSLQLLLRKHQFVTMAIQHPSLISETIATFHPDLVLLDMNFTIDTSGKQGLKALSNILHLRPDQLIILMTGWATVQLAVEGMKLGAKDFIAKPWDNQALVTSIKDILALFLPKENTTQTVTTESNIIGQSIAITDLLDIASKVAITDANVLITGESGTGKELLAEYIHANSKRHQYPFVKVNLGGISESLFESEMFGHRKGSFTDAFTDRIGRFEKADKGTIFLDEIAELNPSSQVKLLRVLQEKTYEVLGSSDVSRSDFRTISATNQDIPSLIHLGQFREDLFYRINLIHLHIPSLRERKEDIPLLVNTFIHKISLAYGFEIPSISDKATFWLTHQSYPGNIRQLKNIVERTLLLNIGKEKLDIQDFEKNFNVQSPSQNMIVLPDVGKISLIDLEIEMIKKALLHNDHSISKTAISLGITRSSLYRRLEKYQIAHES
jgi:two-component system, NtrC family, response regulator